MRYNVKHSSHSQSKLNRTDTCGHYISIKTEWHNLWLLDCYPIERFHKPRFLHANVNRLMLMRKNKKERTHDSCARGSLQNLNACWHTIFFFIAATKSPQDSTRAVIGQFYGPYSTVRPAKFESSPDAISFVYQNLLQRKFWKLLWKHLHSDKTFWETKAKRTGSYKIQTRFFRSFRNWKRPRPRASHKSETWQFSLCRKVEKSNSEWKRFKEFCREFCRIQPPLIAPGMRGGCIRRLVESKRTKHSKQRTCCCCWRSLRQIFNDVRLLFWKRPDSSSSPQTKVR